MDRVFQITIAGTSPLLMHNGQLSNPLNKWAQEMKKLTSKRSKTEDDFRAIMEVEFQGGLYFDDDKHGPVLMLEMLEGMLRDGAKARKLGERFKAGLLCTDEFFPLVYKGPRTRDGLWKAGEQFVDYRRAGIKGNSVMRTRPIFKEWSCRFEIQVIDDGITESDIDLALAHAGSRVGIGDYTPRFGRFKVKELKELAAKAA